MDIMECSSHVCIWKMFLWQESQETLEIIDRYDELQLPCVHLAITLLVKESIKSQYLLIDIMNYGSRVCIWQMINWWRNQENFKTIDGQDELRLPCVHLENALTVKHMKNFNTINLDADNPHETQSYLKKKNHKISQKQFF